MRRARIRSGRLVALLGAGAAILAAPAQAHHSSAMFDSARTVTLVGTVKELQWASPHCWLQVLVPSDAGALEWSVEMAAPFELMRRGWKPVTVRPGDKVTITAYPARDGTRGAMYVTGAGEDGRPLGQGR